MAKFILIVNPGRASRRYSLFLDGQRVVELLFEEIDDKIVCTIRRADDIKQAIIHIDSLNQAINQIFEILDFYEVDVTRADIAKVAVKVIVPSEYFNVHRVLSAEALSRMEDIASADLVGEIRLIKAMLPTVDIVAISDSAFHSTIPEYISYGREHFSQYGVSTGSVVNQLRAGKYLPDRLIVCHLGSRISVTALKRGKTLNTVAAQPPIDTKNLRSLLTERRKGHTKATIAVESYIYHIQRLIGQMAASMGGIDGLVLTGAVGETSAEIRALLLPKLAYLGLEISSDRNHKTHLPDRPAEIGKTEQAVLFVVSSKEDSEMARLAEIIR